MIYPTLTKRQKEILDYIKVYRELNGYAPSLQDIKNHFQLAAISTVHEHLQNLRDKGFIYKEMNQARSIRPLNPEAGKGELFEVPVIGSINTSLLFKKEKIIKPIVIHKSLLPEAGKFFALKIATNELENQHILREDILIMMESEHAENDRIVFVESSQAQLLLKLYKEENGSKVLKDLELGGQTQQANEFTIKGKLKLVVRQF